LHRFFAPRRWQDYHGSQGLGVEARDQVDVARTVFLPKLANLNFRHASGHKGLALTVEAAARGVNCLSRVGYALGTQTLAPRCQKPFDKSKNRPLSRGE